MPASLWTWTAPALDAAHGLAAHGLAVLAAAPAAPAAPAADAGGAFAPTTSLLLAIPFVVVLFVWAKLLAWADKDAEAARLPRDNTNLGLLVGLALGIIAFFLLPFFPLAFAVFLLVLGASAAIYLSIRNKKVGLADLGPEMKEIFLSPFMPKKKIKEGAEPELEEGQVQLYDASGKLVDPPDPESDRRPLYLNAQLMLAGPIIKGAERIDLVPGTGKSQVRYKVDGVTYPGATLDSTAAGATAGYLKRLMGADPDERRRPQQGKIEVKSGTDKHKLQGSTKGSTEGEHVKFEVDVPQRYAMKLDDLGFRKSQLEAFEADKMTGSGLVVAAAPPGNGLKTLLYALIREHDAFVQHIQTFERERPTELEGISHNVVDPDADEAERLDWVTSQLPDVLLVQRLEQQAAARMLSAYAKEKRAYLGVRAGSAFDALTKWRKLVGDDKAALANLRMVVCGRIFRRLCPATKIAFNPDARTRKLMGVSADKKLTLYKPHLGPLRDAKGNEVPDTYCHGLGYKGRIGAYEILMVTDEVRDALRAGAGGQQLKSLFRKQNGRYLQEMALGIVQVGETSVQEVQRVLKGEDAPTKSSSSSSSSKPRATPKPSAPAAG